MSRPIGIIETKQRKPRSDVGKKRKKYGGKLVKGRRRRYVKKIGNKQYLKLRPFYRVPMSKDGYKNWKPHLRPKLYKEVTNMKLSPTFNVPINEINTKRKMEEYWAKNRWGGKFVIMGFGYGKTKTHSKPVSICTIIVKETPEGNVGQMTQNRRLSKYKWFYKG